MSNSTGTMQVNRLFMNVRGQFTYETGGHGHETAVLPKDLFEFFQSRIRRPDEVTDVFVWVHGWRTSDKESLKNANRLFGMIVDRQRAASTAYPKIKKFCPWFIAIHWPSNGTYCAVRDRARAMTEKGEAPFFLAYLLGYLKGRSFEQTLTGSGGFYLHCLGHSFGGRFLSAAIREASQPSPSTIGLSQQASPGSMSLLSGRPTPFEFNIDSMVVFQMAAPSRSFQNEFETLVTNAPLCGPVVLTHTRYDNALGFWHYFVEGEYGVGYCGAIDPGQHISATDLKPIEHLYPPDCFKARIVNVDANQTFKKKGVFVGAHSDFYHPESAHLVMSVVDSMRS